MMDFHPYAEAYPLMPEDELADLVENMKAHGFNDLFPVVEYQGKVLDGRNRTIAAGKLSIEPPTVPFDGDDEAARAFVKTANEHRRHLSLEWLKRRKAERVQRVSKARAEGQSIRTIAKREDVDPMTVKKDLSYSGVDQSTPDGFQVENGKSAEAADETPPPAKVTGKDGKSYKASTRILCRPCRVGKPNPKCKECKSLNAKPPKEKPAPAVEVEPSIPERLKPIFASCAVLRKCIHQGTLLANSLVEVERSPAFLNSVRKGKPQAVTNAAKNIVIACKRALPKEVCPDCKGIEASQDAEQCEQCDGRGYSVVGSE